MWMSFKETELGKVPKHWDIKPLSEITIMQNGYAFKSKDFSDEGNPVIKIRNVNGRIVDLNDCQLYPFELCDNLERFKIFNNDILIAMTGAGSVGRVSKFLKKDSKTYYLNQRVGKIKPDKEVLDNEFLYQIISTDKYESILFDLANGSGQPNLSPDTIGLLKIPCPPIQEQKAISHILSTLDEKIETNNQINKKLEEMAHAIFKQWFVDFEFPNEDGEPYKSSGGELVESEMGMIPKGWEVKNDTELVDSVSIKHKFDKKEVIFLNTSDILNGEVLQTNYSEVSTLPGQAKKSIKKDDILYSEIRPQNRRFAYVDFVADDYVVSTKLMVLRAKTHISSAIIYFLLTNSRTIDELQMIAESRSGTFPQITFNNLKDIKLAIPKDDSLNDKLGLFESILNNLCCIRNENKKLKDIRDTLLPKLMSGEIRVPLNN